MNLEDLLPRSLELPRRQRRRHSNCGARHVGIPLPHHGGSGSLVMFAVSTADDCLISARIGPTLSSVCDFFCHKRTVAAERKPGKRVREDQLMFKRVNFVETSAELMLMIPGLVSNSTSRWTRRPRCAAGLSLFVRHPVDKQCWVIN